MSEHNEREIERLLKSAKSERLSQAGQPKMHPATREMLHTEVQRNYPNAILGRKSKKRWWFGLLPKTAVLLVLGAGVWLLVVRDNSQIPQQLVMERRVEDAATLTDKDSKRTMDELAEATDIRQSVQPEPEVIPPQTMAAPTVSPPLSRQNVAPPAQSASRLPEARRESKSIVGAEYFRAESEEMFIGTASARPRSDLSRGVAEDRAMQALLDVQPAAATAYTQKTVQAGDQSVQIRPLTSFAVINQGNQIRVEDADGSVYSGQIQLVTSGSDAKNSITDSSPRPLILRANTPAAGLEVGDQNSAMVSFTIEVKGTNRSLNQLIHLNGNLSLTEAQFEVGTNRFENILRSGDTRTSSGEAAFAPPTPAGRLTGTATIENGARLPVDAVTIAR